MIAVALKSVNRVVSMLCLCERRSQGSIYCMSKVIVLYLGGSLISKRRTQRI